MVDDADNRGLAGNSGGPDIKHRESALLEMGKALRAISIYPPQHPQRSNIVGQAYGSILVVLQSLGELSFKVSRGGFHYRDKEVGRKQSAVTEMAHEMHLRQIKSFSLRKDLALSDLSGFLELLLEDPDRFRQGKYVADWFKARDIKSVWVNEMDFSRMMTIASEEAEEEDEEEDREEDLGEAGDHIQEVLDLLAAEEDRERFAQLLRELEVIARPYADEKNWLPVWWIVSSVSDQAIEENRPGDDNEPHRAAAVRAVRSLTKGEFLAHLLERYNKQGPDREELRQVFEHTGAPVVDSVMAEISRRESIAMYRPLMELVQGFDKKAVPVLESYLKDENLLKVRRALLLLGELRSRESVEAIRPLLDHKDIKVRREAVRALTFIRGMESSRALVGTLSSEKDTDLRIVIINALGEMKDLAAVPALIKILASTPAREETLPLLEAVVDALGRIGSMEALPHLIKVLNKFTLFNRQMLVPLRVRSAMALGRLGGESSMQALARYARGGDDPLQDTCTKVLERLVANDGKPAEDIEELLK